MDSKLGCIDPGRTSMVLVEVLMEGFHYTTHCIQHKSISCGSMGPRLCQLCERVCCMW